MTAVMARLDPNVAPIGTQAGSVIEGNLQVACAVVQWLETDIARGSERTEQKRRTGAVESCISPINPWPGSHQQSEGEQKQAKKPNGASGSYQLGPGRVEL